MIQVRVSSDGVFHTTQGEGPLVGIPSVFVRFDTCNLRCKWGETLCDAHYTSWTPGDRRVSLDSLVDEVMYKLLKNQCRHLVITGGEPTLQEEALQELCRAATVEHIHTTIETNSTKFVSCSADLICLSPKLESSTPLGTKYEAMHKSNRWNPIVTRRYMECYDYYFKFVIDSERDASEVLLMLSEVGQKLPDPVHVCFMPQGITREEILERGRWMVEWCKRLGVRYSPRLQIDLWGNQPGT